MNISPQYRCLPTGFLGRIHCCFFSLSPVYDGSLNSDYGREGSLVNTLAKPGPCISSSQLGSRRKPAGVSSHRSETGGLLNNRRKIRSEAVRSVALQAVGCRSGKELLFWSSPPFVDRRWRFEYDGVIIFIMRFRNELSYLKTRIFEAYYLRFSKTRVHLRDENRVSSYSIFDWANLFGLTCLISLFRA